MSDAVSPTNPLVFLDVASGDAERVSTLLWDLGACGVEERDATTIDKSGADVTLVGYFDEDEDAERAAAELIEALPGSAPSVRVEHVREDAWRERWKEFFKPTLIGRRLLIRPSWEEVAPEEGRVVLTLDPGQAFGTGTHETTRLVMHEIEERVRGGETVLDVGCGSGILAIAALLLGAERARGVDVDPIAVRTTNENAAENGVTIDASTDPIDRVEGRFDLVLANIRAPILQPMAPALAARTSGTLILSGLLLEEEEATRAAFDPHLEYDSRRVDGEWLALSYRCRGAG